MARNLTSQQSSSLMIYRNGAAETTSFTKNLVDNQSEFSWTRKQTVDENSLYFGSAPTQMLLRSTPSDSANGIKMINGPCREVPGQCDENQRPRTKYEEEIGGFESL